MIPHTLRPILRSVLRDFRWLILSLLYAAVITLCITLAYLLRFDFCLPPWLDNTFLNICMVVVCVHLLCMYAFRQFDVLLSYFGTPDLKRLALACVSAVAVMGVLRLAFGLHFANEVTCCSV